MFFSRHQALHGSLNKNLNVKPVVMAEVFHSMNELNITQRPTPAHPLVNIFIIDSKTYALSQW